MSIFAYALLGIIPIPILNFVVNLEKLWKSLKKTVLMTPNEFFPRHFLTYGHETIV